MVKGKVSGIIANLITVVAEGPIGQMRYACRNGEH